MLQKTEDQPLALSPINKHEFINVQNDFNFLSFQFFKYKG